MKVVTLNESCRSLGKVNNNEKSHRELRKCCSPYQGGLLMSWFRAVFWHDEGGMVVLQG